MYAVMNHKGQVRSYRTRKGAQDGFRTACYRSLPKDLDIDSVCEAQREYDNIAFGDPKDGLYWRNVWCKAVNI